MPCKCYLIIIKIVFACLRFRPACLQEFGIGSVKLYGYAECLLRRSGLVSPNQTYKYLECPAEHLVERTLGAVFMITNFVLCMHAFNEILYELLESVDLLSYYFINIILSHNCVKELIVCLWKEDPTNFYFYFILLLPIQRIAVEQKRVKYYEV
ncbi:uncharacterized protein NDAI_0I03050 [Naumovozyma dairenensis CBS 421]|uniref:Uncharacterized protein n=1 Tax=Naumovozyma dairenensis (strain ATCC 10597 / BCRC 20456 / CBS 421 / NBRC 0211 / NRRL Y-12639) TaxID=1071378 RepID=G0WGG2_NAUDC|nr:hypothetical protein NDAI_0I03050 [Naumovozyma dairenensis CBS 421]CCD26873.1 hypothetical protein NDAI_0I03050 [Naumovozyma dairenensis CBS 421]